MSTATTSVVVPVLWKDADAPGILGTVDVDVRDLPNEHIEGAIVQDLMKAMNKKLRASAEQQDSKVTHRVVSLMLYGARLQNDQSLASLIPELAGSCPRLVAKTRTCVRTRGVDDEGAPMTVFCKTLTGKKIPIDCKSMDSIAIVKTHIENIEGIPIYQQRLVFAGRHLDDDETLDSSGIPDGGTLHLVLRLRGGGMVPLTFADVSNDSILRQQEFSNSAPKWRTVSRGLNIEGRCEKPSCAAFGKMIIRPNHSAAFNLVRDLSISCPECRSPVKPTTCGFYDCVWKFEGVRATDRCLMSSPWKDASGEKYHRFDADESHGSVEWASLLIVVKSREQSTSARLLASADEMGVRVSDTDLCAICWSSFQSTEGAAIATTPCRHSFHRACIDEWCKVCVTHGSLASCPICRRGV